MFIYSKYAKNGVESPEKLVHMLANTGVKALCLIDANEQGTATFLASCTKRDILASIAIPFTCFMEGKEEKQCGFFIASDFASYTNARETIENLHHDFIPYLTEEKLLNLHTLGVYCMVKRKIGYTEIWSCTNVQVHPVAYTNEQQKRKAIERTGDSVGVTVDELVFSPTTIVLVEGMSKAAKPFLDAFEQANKSTNFLAYKEMKEMREKG